MNPEQREPEFSPPSALALSNMEEGMGHNIERAQALHEDLGTKEGLTTTPLCRGSSPSRPRSSSG